VSNTTLAKKEKKREKKNMRIPISPVLSRATDDDAAAERPYSLLAGLARVDRVRSSVTTPPASPDYGFRDAPGGAGGKGCVVWFF
jgi:hypothetical protein